MSYQQSSLCSNVCAYASATAPYFNSNYKTQYNSNDCIDDFVAPNELTISVPQMQSVSKHYSAGLYLSSHHDAHKEYFVVDDFLTNLQKTVFVDDAALIEEYCRTAFKLTTNKELPKNIAIHLCNASELKRSHSQSGGVWSDGIQGFSINRGLKSISEIFVKKDFLDRVMLTLGHEIGHVISPTLPDGRDEEAKAFAFSIAWMRAIVDNNIAGLTNAIALAPAKNGLHDAGYGFVQELLDAGASAFEIFDKLALGLSSINARLETIIIN